MHDEPLDRSVAELLFHEVVVVGRPVPDFVLLQWTPALDHLLGRIAAPSCAGGAQVRATKALLGQARLQRPFPSPLGRGMGSRRPDLSPGDRLLTTREVAAFLGMSPESVLRRYRRGELPGYRLSSNVLRFRESEIEAWLEECLRPGRPIGLRKVRS